MRRAFALMLALLVCLTACSGASSEPQTASMFAMDTVMELQIYGDAGLISKCTDLIHELEASLSVTDDGSEIYNVNRNGSGTVSTDTEELLRRALEICDMTDGALDVTVYPVLRDWGFTTGDYRVPDDAELETLLDGVDYTAVRVSDGSVTLPNGVMIDLGSVAKGWTGDRLAELLRENGVTSALLNLGGNVHTVGSKPDGSPWRVGIQDPFGGSYLGVVEVSDVAVVTSGGYERYFEEDGVTYWHILDPKTGAPARSGVVSVTVIGSEGVLCDGLSTALFVMGIDKAAELWLENGGFEAVLVTDDREIYITEGLSSSFTLMNDYKKAEVKVIRRG